MAAADATTTTTTTTTTPATPTGIISSPKPSFAKMDAFCLEHYDCTETSRFSYEGCVQYWKNDDPTCHLFCQTAKCGADYSPKPQMCVFYTCSLKPDPNNTTTTTSTTTTPTTTTLYPPEPNNRLEDPFFWAVIALAALIILSLSFWLGRKIGRQRASRWLRQQNDFFRRMWPS